MRLSVRFAACGLVGLLVLLVLVMPCVAFAEETTTTAATTAAGESVTGVYGWTATAGSGFKRGGTATIVDNGDTVTIHTVVRNVPVLGVKLNIPVNVDGDKVEVSPGVVRIHVAAKVSVAEGDGEIVFTKTAKGWKIQGSGQGSAGGGGGTATVTGVRHAASWKPTDPPPGASSVVTAIHNAVRWASPDDPAPDPDLVRSATTLFAVLFALAMMAVQTAVFGASVASAGTAASAASAVPPAAGSSPGPTDRGM